MVAPTIPRQRSREAALPQEQEPILCQCRRARLGLLGPHIDHRAEYERARLTGVFDGDVPRGMSRTAWRLEADRRWPDAPDMVEPATGDDRWATVAWCGPLTVHLHETRELAAAVPILNGDVCGHGCWHDHELVDLAEPEEIDEAAEWIRGPRRAGHARSCSECLDWSAGQLPAAAMRRAHERRLVLALVAAARETKNEPATVSETSVAGSVTGGTRDANRQD